MPVWLAILLADVVLVVHFLIAAFNILALPATVLGLAMGWQFARNRFFRLAHLVCMGVVLLFAALGRYCPLTDWESALRIAAGQEPNGAYPAAGCVGRKKISRYPTPVEIGRAHV